MLSLFSKVVCYTNIYEKIVCNKGSSHKTCINVRGREELSPNVGVRQTFVLELIALSKLFPNSCPSLLGNFLIVSLVISSSLCSLFPFLKLLLFNYKIFWTYLLIFLCFLSFFVLLYERFFLTFSSNSVTKFFISAVIFLVSKFKF